VRAVVQRVRRAEVRVDGVVRGRIERALLVYMGVTGGDGADDVEYTASKIAGLRVFEDREGKMNLNVEEAGGGVLAVSQFTLLGDVRKGRRPSFVGAEKPEAALETFDHVVEALRHRGLTVETGVFQAHMEVDSVNDGPVTILLDSSKLF